MKRKISIIIVIRLFDIGFDVFFIVGAALLLFSCFCFVIGRLAFTTTNDTLKFVSKR